MGNFFEIDYTSEMETQDELWESKNEDRELLGLLFLEIVEQARERGLVIKYVVHEDTDSHGLQSQIVDIIADNQVRSFYTCNALILYLVELDAKWEKEVISILHNAIIRDKIDNT